MRVIASILLLATLVQMPMMIGTVSAKEETQEAVFETVEEKAETVLLTVKTEETEKTAEEAKAEETEETEEIEEIIYKEIVKAEPIDTSKPILQDVSGTLSTGNGQPYALTDYERDLIERVVMAEIRGGTYNDKLAVAQCIYDRIVCNGKTVEQVIFQKNAFAEPYSKKDPSQSVKDAVSEVFDEGKRVTKEPIFYFIATYAVTSDCFHETQKCVYVTEDHRYYSTWKY